MMFLCNQVNNISVILYFAVGAMGVYNEYEGSTKLLEKKA